MLSVLRTHPSYACYLLLYGALAGCASHGERPAVHSPLAGEAALAGLPEERSELESLAAQNDGIGAGPERLKIAIAAYEKLLKPPEAGPPEAGPPEAGPPEAGEAAAGEHAWKLARAYFHLAELDETNNMAEIGS